MNVNSLWSLATGYFFLCTDKIDSSDNKTISISKNYISIYVTLCFEKDGKEEERKKIHYTIKS